MLAVVLVAPKTPGNIGAAARAMLNMGADDLRLVSPRTDHLDSEALALAVHADGVLRAARVFPTLDAALQDRDFAIGTTARARKDMPPPRAPETLRPALARAAAPALVFGPEEHGLASADLERCQAVMRIPTAEYASINLGQAVLLGCYSLLQEGSTRAPDARQLAARERMEGLYGHLEAVMHLTGYTDQKRARHTVRLWRILLDRAQMSEAEVRLFRGLLRQVGWAVRQGPVREPEGPVREPEAPVREPEAPVREPEAPRDPT